MFKCVGAYVDENKFDILDTEDGSVDSMTAEEVSDALRGGFVIEGLPSDLFGEVDLCAAPENSSEWVAPVQTKNRNLTKAKKAKNDDFYTQLSDIERELSHYPIDAFKDKVIYCPTDVAITDGAIKQSQFIRYFQQNAHKLQFKKLIATCLVEKTDGVGRNYYVLTRRTSATCTQERRLSGESPIDEVMRDDGRVYYKYRIAHRTPNHRYAIDEGDFRYIPVPTTTVNQAMTDEDGNKVYNGEDAWDNQYYIFQDNLDAEGRCPADPKYGSGDFRSDFCTKLLEESDIVVTNPPFSLFREFMAWMFSAGSLFIVIANMNCVNYMLPDLAAQRFNIGFNAPGGTRKGNSLLFSVPDSNELRDVTAWWFTNFSIKNSSLHGLSSYLTYEENKSVGVDYVEYDNYRAIEVSSEKKLPKDYLGVMGVPISALKYLDTSEFDIVGCAIAGYSYCELTGVRKNENKKDAAYLDGKKMYARVLIRLNFKNWFSQLLHSPAGDLLYLFERLMQEGAKILGAESGAPLAGDAYLVVSQALLLPDIMTHSREYSGYGSMRDRCMSWLDTYLIPYITSPDGICLVSAEELCNLRNTFVHGLSLDVLLENGMIMGSIDIVDDEPPVVSVNILNICIQLVNTALGYFLDNFRSFDRPVLLDKKLFSEYGDLSYVREFVKSQWKRRSCYGNQ